MTRRHHRGGGLDLRRNARIPREMVERAQRQDAQRLAGPGELACGAADRSVPAARYDGVESFRICRFAELGENVLGAGQPDLGGDPLRFEGGAEAVGEPVVAGPNDRSAAAVDDRPNLGGSRAQAGPIRNAQSLWPSGSRK
jgi:hypothetical protein